MSTTTPARTVRVLDQKYQHLLPYGETEHVVLEGPAEAVMLEDLIMDGMYQVKTITQSKHHDEPALTFGIVPIDAQNARLGRVTMLTYAPMIFARFTFTERFDPATDRVGAHEYEPAVTRDLGHDDLVGYSPNGRTGEIKYVDRVLDNGLIVFDDGTAVQSTPDSHWWRVVVEHFDDDHPIPLSRNERAKSGLEPGGSCRG